MFVFRYDRWRDVEVTVKKLIGAVVRDGVTLELKPCK